MRASRMSADQRREQLVDVALPEFARAGFHGTSMETIARAAGITQPYTFRLFTGGKAELFCACLTRVFTQMTQAMLDASNELTGLEALMAMGNVDRELVLDETLLLVQLQGFAAARSEDKTPIRDTVRSLYAAQWTAVSERTGLDRATVKVFMGLGALLNTLTALEVDGMDDEWSREASWRRSPITEDVFAAIIARTQPRG